MGEETFFDETKIYALLYGLAILILTLLSVQLWGAVLAYYAQLKLGWVVLISLVGSILGMIECKVVANHRQWPKSLRLLTLGLLLLVIFLAVRSASLAIQVLSSGIILIIYRLAYSLAAVSERFRFDPQQSTGISKNYEYNLAGYKQLKKLVIQINLLIIISWLFIGRVNRELLLLGVAVFLLQFILLGIGFYLKKRISWQLENRRLNANLFSRWLAWLVLIAVIMSVGAGLLPVRFDQAWQVIENQAKQLLINTTIMEPRSVDIKPGVETSSSGGPIQREQPDSMTWYSVLFLFVVGLGLTGLLILVVVIGGKLLWEFIMQEERKNIKQLPQLLIEICQQVVKLIKQWLAIFSGSNQQLKADQAADKAAKNYQSVVEPGEIDRSQLNLDPDLPRDKIVLLFLQAKDFFVDSGLKFRRAETLVEYLARVKIEFATYQSQIDVIHRLIAEAVYSNHQLTDKEVQKMKTAVEAVTTKQIK